MPENPKISYFLDFFKSYILVQVNFDHCICLNIQISKSLNPCFGQISKSPNKIDLSLGEARMVLNPNKIPNPYASQLARACGVPVGRCSGGRLAITLVATINVIIFFFFFFLFSFSFFFFLLRRLLFS